MFCIQERLKFCHTLKMKTEEYAQINKILRLKNKPPKFKQFPFNKNHFYQKNTFVSSHSTDLHITTTIH